MGCIGPRGQNLLPEIKKRCCNEVHWAPGESHRTLTHKQEGVVGLKLKNKMESLVLNSKQDGIVSFRLV